MTAGRRWSTSLTSRERKLAEVLVAKLEIESLWRAHYRPALEVLVSSHVRAGRLAKSDRARTASGRRRASESVRDLRLLARQIAAGMFLLPLDRVAVVRLDATGVDVELERLFDPARQLVPAADAPQPLWWWRGTRVCSRCQRLAGRSHRGPSAVARQEPPNLTQRAAALSGRARTRRAAGEASARSRTQASGDVNDG